MPEISQEEFHEWLLNPVTKALKAQWQADRERLMESWASGAFAGNPEREAEMRGQCQILGQFLALEIEDLSDQEP